MERIIYKLARVLKRLKRQQCNANGSEYRLHCHANSSLLLDGSVTINTLDSSAKSRGFQTNSVSSFYAFSLHCNLMANRFDAITTDFWSSCESNETTDALGQNEKAQPKRKERQTVSHPNTVRRTELFHIHICAHALVKLNLAEPQQQQQQQTFHEFDCTFQTELSVYCVSFTYRQTARNAYRSVI